MSEPKSTIETRPSLEIQTAANVPQPLDVAIFDEMAIKYPTETLDALARWPGFAFEPRDPEVTTAIHKSITNLLIASNSGKNLDFDNHTWGYIESNPAFELATEAIKSSTKTGEDADVLRRKPALIAVGAYVTRLARWATENPDTPSKNVA